LTSSQGNLVIISKQKSFKKPNRRKTKPMKFFFDRIDKNRTAGFIFLTEPKKTKPIKTLTAWPYKQTTKQKTVMPLPASLFFVSKKSSIYDCQLVSGVWPQLDFFVINFIFVTFLAKNILCSKFGYNSSFFSAAVKMRNSTHVSQKNLFLLMQ